MSQFVSDEHFDRLIEAFAGICLVIGPRQSSAGEFILCLSTHIREKSLSYPLGGMRAVPMAYLKATENRSGEVRYSSPVQRIVVEGGRVRGVEADGFISADIVISNTGIKETMGLVGRQNVPDSYLEMVDNLRLSYGAVSVKYALDTEIVTPHVIIYYPDTSIKELAERQAAVSYRCRRQPTLPGTARLPDGACRMPGPAGAGEPGRGGQDLRSGHTTA